MKDTAMATGLFNLPNDNSLALSLIYMIRLSAGKGLVLYNSYNKLLDFVKEANDEVSRAYKAAIEAEMKAGKHWKQPDWKAIREEVLTRPTVQRPERDPRG